MGSVSHEVGRIAEAAVENVSRVESRVVEVVEVNFLMLMV